MPQTPHFLGPWKKISEPVELWPETLFLRPEFQFWASFCKCCRSLQHFSPHWTNVVPQLPNLVSASIWGIILRNVADHSTFLSPPASPNGKSDAQFGICGHKMQNVVPI